MKSCESRYSLVFVFSLALKQGAKALEERLNECSELFADMVTQFPNLPTDQKKAFREVSSSAVLADWLFSA